MAAPEERADSWEVPEPNLAHLLEDEIAAADFFIEKQQRLLIELLYASWDCPEPDA